MLLSEYSFLPGLTISYPYSPFQPHAGESHDSTQTKMLTSKAATGAEQMLLVWKKKAENLRNGEYVHYF